MSAVLWEYAQFFGESVPDDAKWRMAGMKVIDNLNDPPESKVLYMKGGCFEPGAALKFNFVSDIAGIRLFKHVHFEKTNIMVGFRRLKTKLVTVARDESVPVTGKMVGLRFVAAITGETLATFAADRNMYMNTLKKLLAKNIGGGNTIYMFLDGDQQVPNCKMVKHLGQHAAEPAQPAKPAKRVRKAKKIKGC